MNIRSRFIAGEHVRCKHTILGINKNEIVTVETGLKHPKTHKINVITALGRKVSIKSKYLAKLK